MNQRPKLRITLARRRHRRRSGQTLVEYALLLAYISIIIINGMQQLSVGTTESLIDADLGLAISTSSSKAAAQAAVLTFLDSYNYGNYSAAQRTAIYNTCYTNAMNIINSLPMSSS